MDEAKIPILVACGQIVERDKSGLGSTPLELMVAACQAAAKDSGSLDLLASTTHLAATGLTIDADLVNTPLSGGYRNLPKSVANRLNIHPREFYYVATGGNTPQYLVNRFAEQIAEGSAETVLLVGGEALATMQAKFNHFYKWFLPNKSGWKDNPGGKPTLLGDQRKSCNQMEARHGLGLPANVYPIFENALQHRYESTAQQHHINIGEIYSKFSQVAEGNPLAWFQQAYSASELITETASNRMVAYPYTKLLNSMISVNQAAAVILTSVSKARRLGVPENRWVYLHGCADANDIWNVTERVDYHSSPALRRCGQEALSMADKGIDEISYFDIYSCFPSAVQIARDEFGIPRDDARSLTLTGGLPYFGGPGNNYSMHGIAEMMIKLRSDAGSFGLLNANGWYLTKHSLGVYSTEPISRVWRRKPPASYQAEVLEQRGPTVCVLPQGTGRVETFTVLFDRNQQATRGIVIGRDESNQRFVANTPKDEGMMLELCNGPSIGRNLSVRTKRNRNIVSLL